MYSLKQLSVLLFICYIFTIVDSKIWKKCPSTEGSVKEVLIPGCSTAPCQLKRGQNTTFIVDFITEGVIVKDAKAVVHGVVGGVPIPFPPPQVDGCQKCGISCPLKKKTSYSYKTVLFVKKSYPSLKVVVKWELKDSETNADIFCVEVPVVLV